MARKSGVFGKIFKSILFLILILVGIGFTYLLTQQFIHTVDTYSWTATPAEINQVTITRHQKSDKDSTPYELLLSYSYEVNGRTYHHSIRGNNQRYSNYEYADDFARKSPAGSTQTIYVNPMDPSESILTHDSFWIGLFILLPLILVAIGGGGLYDIWIGSKKRALSPQNIAKSSKNAARIPWIIGIVFILAGVIGCSFFAHMVFATLRAQSWVKTPATVIESAVIRHETHNDNGGTSYTYSIDIFYEYQFSGKSYRASRYDFIGGSSSGYSAKRAIVKKYPSGKKFTVYVNPNNPRESVIHPGFSWFFLIIFLPLTFLIVGLLVLSSQLGLRSTRSKFYPTDIATETSYRISGDGGSGGSLRSGPVMLKPQTSPLGKVIGSLLICLFWNGIVSVFVSQAYSAWTSGNPDWFLMIFLIPFVIVGLALVLLVLYMMLAFFNPVIEVQVNTTSPRLGDELAIQWNTKGNTRRIRELTLSLEALEEVRFRRGKSTTTERHTFFKTEIYKAQDTLSITTGSVRCKIPEDQMHSLTAGNSKIIWQLNVHGDIQKWPDVNEAFTLDCLPMEER